MEHSTPVLPENVISSENDDDFEYMLPPIGAVAFAPDGCPATIRRVLHTPRATWFLLEPGGWFPEHRLIYGTRPLR